MNKLLRYNYLTEYLYPRYCRQKCEIKCRNYQVDFPHSKFGEDFIFKVFKPLFRMACKQKLLFCKILSVSEPTRINFLGKSEDFLFIRKFVCRMKASKSKMVNSQIFEKAANLWPYVGS